MACISSVRRWTVLLVGPALLALASCGGGGSGTPSSSTGPLALDSSNYVQAVTVALSVGDSNLFSALEVLTGVEQKPSDLLLRASLGKAVQLLRRKDFLESLTGVTQTSVEPCSGGGSVSVTATVAVQGRTSTGDRIVLTFTSCRELGLVINGQMDAGVGAVSGNPEVGPPFSLSLNVSLRDLTASGSGETASASGDLGLALSVDAAGGETNVLTVPSLTVNSTVGGVSSSQGLSDFSLTGESLSSGSRYAFAGRITSSDLGRKHFDVRTITTFFEPITSLYPTSGAFELTGASGSRVRVSAQAGGTALIQLDANGDGIFETSTSRSWDSL